MKIFAIETSCDETALSLVECSGGAKKPQFKVLKNLISTQIKIHRPFGGVVPSLAKREHIKNLPKLLQKIFSVPRNAKRISTKGKTLHATRHTFRDVDAIAVTVGPGLEPALWQGIVFAQELAKKFGKPLIGANHMEGHMYSILLPKNAVKSQLPITKLRIKAFGQPHTQIKFPAVGLVVSGGHTILVRMDSFRKWQKLGETRDDAAGEAFDKVAKMLGLQYPGGPEIQKIAVKGDPKAVNFPRPMINSKDYDFSFSGLKTAVLYHIRDNKNKLQRKNYKADIAASFQKAVIDTLVSKAMRASREYGAQSVFLCGGVAANKPLRAALEREASERGMTFLVPEFIFNTDNAVMIAAAAYLGHLRKKSYPIKADPNLNL